jgi:DNA-binding NtrC family response regulator
VSEKKLREDLYYRLSAFKIYVPPLRQRKEEIKVLLSYSMHKLARYYGLRPREFTPLALAACQNHSWPGNLKELETFVKRYLVGGDQDPTLRRLEPESESDGSRILPVTGEEGEAGASAAAPTSLKSLVQSVKWKTEQKAIAAALEKTGWNRKAAARLLGVSYRTMLYKIDQYHMTASEPFFPWNEVNRFWSA